MTKIGLLLCEVTRYYQKWRQVVATIKKSGKLYRPMKNALLEQITFSRKSIFPVRDEKRGLTELMHFDKNCHYDNERYVHLYFVG